MNYYNEIDAKACAWLRALIEEGLIPEGEVDSRSIRDVRAGDLRGFRQCHFFAGIGGWSLALRFAGWPEDRSVWTGSCPCQPLSCAGKQKGDADERHLWPDFYRLIAECNPAIVFGEQVASKAGREWFAGVRADLEGMGYACGCADLCAAGVGAPHIRQRLYWVAISNGGTGQQGQPQPIEWPISPGNGEYSCRVADAGHCGHRQERDTTAGRGESECVCGMGHATKPGFQGSKSELLPGGQAERRLPAGSSFWADSIWHQCRDGRARRIPPEPILQCVAPGLSDALDAIRSKSVFKIKERILTYAAKSKTSPQEILCALRDTIAPEDNRGTRGISETEVLFSALRELEGQVGKLENSDSPGGVQGAQGPLRKVRIETADQTTPPSPQERDGLRQRIDQLRDSLYELSHEGTLEAEAISFAVSGFPLSPRLPGQVAMLKGFGNAICPPLAAEFIKAAVESIEMTKGKV